MTTKVSLCPHCLTRIPAIHVAEGDKIYLEKICAQHGNFRVLLWEGAPSLTAWTKPKISGKLKTRFTKVNRGCPFDCGLCSDHRQETCTALLEVTRRCNLNCCVCFADAGGPINNEDPDLAVIRGWYEKLLAAGGPYNIQLSGGEPTIRDDLPEIVALGKAMGFNFIQINTNGLRFTRETDYLKKLRDAGATSVFLQFDGTNDGIYRQLRGRSLLQDKIRAIENCGDLNMGVILVPTLVPGVNLDNVGEIIRLALRYQPVIRGVHFQPVSYFGRYPQVPGEERITIPRLIREIAVQTEDMVKIQDFRPPGCENAMCSFHGNFTFQSGEGLRARPATDTCCSSENAANGAQKNRNFVARTWSGRQLNNPFRQSKDQVADSWNELINKLLTHSFTISGMAFQDVWNFDLDRIRDCCIHVVNPEGRLIPFCAYNLTGIRGQSLYRNGRKV
jgi:uncharacterized radical SAM superfamily Fe-S cluster-containing enzyme